MLAPPRDRTRPEASVAKSQALIDVDKDAFKATFSEVSVYIREEWPEVEADALAATADALNAR